MSNYTFNTLVSKQEQDALKEMILKRAQERAKTLNDETSASYTSSIKNEVMDLARSSFSANKNPFSLKFNTGENKETTEAEKESLKNPKEKVEELKRKIYEHQESQKNEILNSFIKSSMDEARFTPNSKQQFIGALNFLNSQASLKILETRNRKFDTLA